MSAHPAGSGPELLNTEQRHPGSTSLGSMSPAQVIALMAAEEHVVIDAVARASAALAHAAQEVARSYRAGGRTILLGSGSSGLIIAQEVAELPPTFSVAADRFRAFVASQAPVSPDVVRTTEDAHDDGAAAMATLGLGGDDVVIGVAASGITPFVIGGMAAARQAGAWCCGIANNPATPVLAAADLPILLDTGPELLTGSTRLKAGTAQKIALNRITTAAMVACGLVRGNHMIELRGGNEKLRRRAVRIVTDVTGLDAAAAADALADNGWHVGETVRALERTTEPAVPAVAVEAAVPVDGKHSRSR